MYKQPVMMTITTQNNDQIPTEKTVDKDSWGEKIKQSSLRLSGVSYFAADIAFAGRGLSTKPKDWGDIGFGAFFALGSLLLGRYGKTSPERSLELQSQKLGKVFEEQAISISDNSELAQKHLLKKRSQFEKIEDFLYKYPSQVFGGFISAAAASGIRANWGKNTPESLWKLASSSLVMTGALISMLVSEMTEEEKQQKKLQPTTAKPTPVSRVMDWVKEKPLRSAGLLWATHNAFYAGGIINSIAKKEHSKMNYGFGFTAVGLNLIAAALYSMSSTGQGKISDKGVSNNDHKIERMAAQVISTQPLAMQETLLKQTAQAMVTQGGLPITAAALEQEMRTQLDKHLLASEQKASATVNAIQLQERIANQPMPGLPK
jgi:hypothetical protein